MKGTDQFNKAIDDHLKGLAKTDPLFAETLKKPNKSLKECVNYIYSEVRKLGAHMLLDEEVFNMAVHYYDEDSIKNVPDVSGKVSVKHSTANGVKKVQEKEESMVIKHPAVKKSKSVITNQPSLF